MNDKTADETASHLTDVTTGLSANPPQYGGKVAGYNPAIHAGQAIARGHSTRFSKNNSRAAGYKLKLFIAFVAGLTLSFPVAAKLYKWVDNNGITHYGETIPPEYADKDRVELNTQGQVIKSEEVMTPERRRAKELEDKKKREDADAAAEQQRRDRTLLNTYSNVHEIDLARTRSLQQVNARINMLETYVKSANDNVLSLQNEADRYSEANKNIPDSLQEDMKDAQKRLASLQQDLEKPRADKAALEARFAADRARYIELTGKK